MDTTSTSARLLRLLALLQSRREWSGPQLGASLAVDVRTLRRDMQRLRELGYEIHASTGPGGGYRLGAGTQLPPLRLEDDEAVALSVALAGVAAQAPQLRDPALRALVKLTQVLPARLRRKAGDLHAVTLTLGGGPAVSPSVLATLAAACREHRLSTFHYTDGRDVGSRRTVEPLRLIHTGRTWYLLAWDVARADWRTFRVDRVDAARGVDLQGTFAARPPPPDVEAFVSHALSTAPYALQARARIALPHTQAARHVPAWVGTLRSTGPRTCELTTGAATVDALVAQLVLAGVDFTLEEPVFARADLVRIGKRLQRAGRRTPRARRG